MPAFSEVFYCCIR